MIEEYLEVLADLSVSESYNPRDRYNDFRKIFLETEQGRRILKQVLAWGHLLHVSPVRDPVDPWRMVFAEGERNMALRIFSVMLVEPPDKPEKQTQTQKN